MNVIYVPGLCQLQSRTWPSVLTQNADPISSLQYENALIDYPKKVDGLTADEDDEDDDDDGLDPLAVGEEDDDDSYSSVDDGVPNYDDYDYTHTETTPTSKTTAETGGETDSSSSASNDDNVFDDFTNYNAHKKKIER